jgi:hypothetical protein
LNSDDDLLAQDAFYHSQQESPILREKSYEQKLRLMSAAELVQELGTLKWHYALFKDQKKFQKICQVELEIASRKGSLASSQSSGIER